MNGFFKIAIPKNEPVLNYAPNSAERQLLLDTYNKMYNEKIDIPMFIGGKEVFTTEKKVCTLPHDHKHIVAEHAWGNKHHVEQAITAALNAKKDWEQFSWHERAAIFMRAADLLSTKYRFVLNAATMLSQSKNVYQAEIDAACELIDFWRFNCYYLTQIYSEQPESAFGIWNKLNYRPLEGFVFALTPFNFTAIAGNLPTSAALMGNTVVWKVSDAQIYSAYFIMKILQEAGLPDGVINLIYADGKEVGDVIFNHRDFAGIHFTGSTGVFQEIWKTIGNNISKYKSYPRIVGETGGKDFVVVHPSAQVKPVVANLIRGSFEYQGQKCSAASRAYIPKSLWSEVKTLLVDEIKTIKIGSPADTSNFMNAVISEPAFDRIASYIEYCKKLDISRKHQENIQSAQTEQQQSL